jgi:DNA-binding PadR family transcriptional regulator
MKLTPRQQAFLDKLFDLYREFNGPVHYSVVAERLGVNKFSAYDMLKLLEEKGVAASSYVLGKGHNGPGRSMVVFYPTHKAARFLTQLRHEVLAGEEWHQAKEHLLQRLRETQESNYAEAVRELLAHLPDVKTPLIYCTEMIGVLLLNLAYASKQAGELIPHRLLTSLTALDEVGLGTLAGFSLGSIISNQAGDPPFVSKLISHTKRFQTYLSELSEESVNRLVTFLQDALNAFEP